MRTTLLPLVRRGLAVVLGAGVLFPAQAGVSVGVDVTLPVYGTVYPALPGTAVYIGAHRGHRYWYGGGLWYRPWGPRWVVVAPPPGLVVPAEAVAAAPAAPPKPDPVIYPRQGQGPEQTELDRQECNRWAVSQPQAVADASVFQRAVEACLDGRGYTVR